MLGLSKSTGYAIAALRSLSKISSKYEAIEEISRCAIVPKDYLAKIVGALARAGLVKTKRGVGGGISLACSPAQITLLEVVEAVEGKNWLSDCLLGLGECTDLATCPTHDLWQRVSREIKDELRTTTLETVIAFMDQGSRTQRSPSARQSRRRAASKA